MDAAALKTRAIAEIDAHADHLLDLSHRIHANPETAYHEVRACAWIAELMTRHGFEVETGIAKLQTAMRASSGSGRPAVAVLAEYDALPVIGHGCGHNIIAATAVGAAVGVKAVIGDTGGQIQMIGTPAEEIYGGKVAMIREGAFDGLDAAIMTHPGGRDVVFAKALACAEVKVEYFGQEAHAAAQPERGVNALEAMIIAFNSINSMRQHIRRSARIHGVITDGGQAPNIVPGYSAGSFMVRSEDDAYLEEMKSRAVDCFEAGARATGARLALTWNENQYAAMNTNTVIAEAHRKNLIAIGRKLPEHEDPLPLGSTDMGNVSRIVPAIHPGIAIAPLDVNGHSPQFCEYAASPAGDKACIDGAKALAMTAIDILTDAVLREAMRAEFEQLQHTLAGADAS
jgi:amidohydrolase